MSQNTTTYLLGVIYLYLVVFTLSCVLTHSAPIL